MASAIMISVTDAGRESGRATDGSGETAAVHPACQRALQHVATLSAGPPTEVSLRVTLNFHPDRIAAGRPILHAGVGGCLRDRTVREWIPLRS